MTNSDGFFSGKILDIAFQNDLGGNLDKTFDDDFESILDKIKKESFCFIYFPFTCLLKNKHQKMIY